MPGAYVTLALTLLNIIGNQSTEIKIWINELSNGNRYEATSTLEGNWK